MASRAKIIKWLGLAALLLAVVAAVVVLWVVPAAVAHVVEEKYQGHVTIGGWWVNSGSIGVTGLKLHESPEASSPVWAEVERVTTDLTPGGLLRGRATPGTVTLHAPRLSLRFAQDGKLATKIPLVPPKGPEEALPRIVIEDAHAELAQEGRAKMSIGGIRGEVAPAEAGAVRLSARADDPTWGTWAVNGSFAAGFKSGEVDLATAKPLSVTPELAASVPCIPDETWKRVRPTGPVDLRLSFGIDQSRKNPLRVGADVNLRGGSATLTNLDLTATQTTGSLRVVDGLVTLTDVAGHSLGGTMNAGGTLDFTKTVPAFDLAIRLDSVDVSAAPKAWQFEELGASGRLTGHAQMKVTFPPTGPDLTGSTGEADLLGGVIQGIPIKSLHVAMDAEGSDLRYNSGDPASPPEDAAKPPADPKPPATSRLDPARARPAWRRASLQAPGQGPAEPAKPPQEGPPKPPKAPSRPGIRLPESLTTRIELEDVDLAKIVAQGESLSKFKMPLPIAARFSMKAAATIPLGSFKDVSRYAFHGDASLAGVKVGNVFLGRIAARIDLQDGVLNLTDVRGLLKPAAANPGGKLEAEAAPPEKAGPLPPGGYRGSVRVGLAPRGRMEAHYAARAVPLGGLIAEATGKLAPLQGLVSLDVKAGADLERLGDPRAWTAEGRLDGQGLAPQGLGVDVALDSASSGFRVAGGRLDVPDLTAKLRGHAVAGSLGADITPPYAYVAHLDAPGWAIAEILKLLPGAPATAPASGVLGLTADARGAVETGDFSARGRGRFAKLEVRAGAGPIPMGDLAFAWAADRNAVTLTDVDARPFGGRVRAEARIPLSAAGGAIDGSATISHLDVSKVLPTRPGEARDVSGTVDGTANFHIPRDGTPPTGEIRVKAPDLIVRGVPAERVVASIHLNGDKLHYDIAADGQDNRVRFGGSLFVPALAGKGPRTNADGELQAVGFPLATIWKGLGMDGAASHLRGVAAMDAALRDAADGSGLWVRGIAEVRNLSWGDHMPLGRLKGVVALTPTSWRIGPVNGDLLGGVATGSAWSETVPGQDKHIVYDLRVDRASLSRVAAVLPNLSHRVDGFGSLRLIGSFDRAVRAEGHLNIPHARVFGLSLVDLRAPVELVMDPGTGTGTLSLRHAEARLAGGRVRAEGRAHIGLNHSFEAKAHFGSVDIESFTRGGSDKKKPNTGRVTGTISVNGPDPTQPKRFRGRVDVDLDDASLVAVPVLAQIDRFLGAARGGLFEDGDVHAAINGGILSLESLTLNGRLAQVHATGTVNYLSGQVDLVALVNTNQIISETGQSLLSLIPGLRDAVGRGGEATRRLSGYLSAKLLKLHITGTMSNPTVVIDPSLDVGDAATGFFADVLSLPMNLVR